MRQSRSSSKAGGGASKVRNMSGLSQPGGRVVGLGEEKRVCSLRGDPTRVMRE